MMTAMMKYALYDYVPKKFLRRATFEQRELHRMILAFKDGRNLYSGWAARQFAYTLSQMDLREATLVCVPASSAYTHVRRWKRFLGMLCRMTGAQNGYDHVRVLGCRDKVHVTKDYAYCSNIKHYVGIDADFFKGKKVIVIDDIYTTGKSSQAFISAVQTAGADVTMALFLAKTKMSYTPPARL